MRTAGFTFRLALLLVLSGCSTTDTSSRDWLKEMAARETALPPPVTFTSPDGKFRATAAAKLSRPMATDESGVRNAEFEIGTEATIACVVFPQTLDVADTLSTITSGLMEEVAENNGEIQSKSIYEVDAGEADNRPYITVSWLGVADRKAFMLKQAAGITPDGGTIWCLHEGIGYSHTFREFFEGLLASSEFASNATEPDFAQTTLLRMNGATVGYSHVVIRKAPEAETWVETYESMLIPVAPDAVASTDRFGLEQAHDDGRVKRALNRRMRDGEVVSDLTLGPDGNNWAVYGSMQGKEISAKFASSTPLMSSLADYKLAADLVKGGEKGSRIDYQRWVDLQPTEAMDCYMQHDGNADDGSINATMVAGPLSMIGVLDRNGFQSGKTSMGHLQVEMERAAIVGSL